MLSDSYYPESGSLAEKKYQEAPHCDLAAIISLHYLVLALRKKDKGRPVLREHYTSEALLWRREAINLLARAHLGERIASLVKRKDFHRGGIRQR